MSVVIFNIPTSQGREIINEEVLDPCRILPHLRVDSEWSHKLIPNLAMILDLYTNDLWQLELSTLLQSS